MTRLLKMIKIMMVSRFRGESMMKCEEALYSLFEYLDGEVDESTERRVREHLEVCRRCYSRAEFERAFLEAVASSAHSERVPDSVRERVLAVLDDDGWSPAT